MYILGINAYHPDSSACIIKDGKLLAAVEEERFRRIKHWAGFPAQSLQYCLKEAGIDPEQLNYIAVNRDPAANFFKKVIFVLTKRPPGDLVKDRLANLAKIRNIKNMVASEFKLAPQQIKAKLSCIEHHRAHLASTFFVSPFKEATLISLDGFGDFSSAMVAMGIGNKIKVLYSANYPHSLGVFYTAFTQFIGFKNFGDEYKVMGLSAFGKPRYLDKMKEVLILKPGGKFVLNPEYFSFYKGGEAFAWDNAQPQLKDLFSQKLIEKFGFPRAPEEKVNEYHCDLAASLQAAYEQAFFHILNCALKKTGIANLCLAGGCALNSAANGKIFDRSGFKEVYIQPASSDAGGALGAAFYLYHHILNHKRVFLMEHAYWGPQFSDNEIDAVLKTNANLLSAGSCQLIQIERSDELCVKTAREIADGKIVGWFQGRMEYGPRALGNRSILVDPRRKGMQDILNARIKRRENFRPFAPAILKECTAEFFEKSYPDPFMLKVYPVRADKRHLIPAVTHADGTGRLQTVGKDENPLFWRLIKEFQAITGIPVLLNTSFNDNEPIVCTPQQALECFLRTKMDVLVLGKVMIKRV